MVRCCICGTDLSSQPAMRDNVTNLAYCRSHASSMSAHDADDLSRCPVCAFRFVYPRATFDPKGPCPACGSNLDGTRGGSPAEDAATMGNPPLVESATAHLPLTSAIEEWMDQAPPGDPLELVSILDDTALFWESDWGTGTKSVVLEVLQRCVARDLAAGHSSIEFVGMAVNNRLVDFKVQPPPDGWHKDGIASSVLRFCAGLSLHMIAKLDSERYALVVHSGEGGIQERAGKEKDHLLGPAEAAAVERGKTLVPAHPFPEDHIKQYYGSLEGFAKGSGCIKVYQSDDGFHMVRFPSDEQIILASPSVSNPKLVWVSLGVTVV